MNNSTHLHSLRQTTSQALTAGLAFSLAAFASSDALAQQAAKPKPASGNDPQAANNGAVELPPIIVDGGRGDPNVLRSTTGLSRLPGTVQDVPQTVNVITQKTLQEQGVTTLDQALKNVPGVTVSIGEGGGGMNGDQFRIRGFQAKGDIYTDGLRDFGVYVRDSFAYEQVDVIKGPSSESFGMGSSGGVVNNSLKNAHLGDSYAVQGMLGNGPLLRAEADINKQINDTTAIRFVGMIHDQEIVDRDNIFSDRWGFLASAGFGLGTDRTWTVNYLHQEGKRRPDMGLPILTPAGGVGLPMPEFGVARSTYLGKVTDLDDSQVDMVTSRFNWDVNDWLTVSNDTRLAAYNRYFAQGVNNCGATVAALFCAQNVMAGNFNVPYGFGGPAGFSQQSWGAQNITTAVAKFETGFLRHELVAGLDLFYQNDKRRQLYNKGPKIAGTVANPNFNADTYTVIDSPSIKQGNSTNVGVFASDRVWLTKQFSILAGARWDSYEAEYAYTNALGIEQTPSFTDSSFVSPKASLIWEPTQSQTYYVSWARSYAPVGQFITNDNAGVPTNNSRNVDPEESELLEAGAKVSFLNDRLGLTAALFQVTKKNSVDIDPTTGLANVTFGDSGEERKVQGIELGVTGKITDAWNVQFAYAFLDSEVVKSTNPLAIGKDAPFVSQHSASLWTTYNIAAHLPNIPGELLIGGGVTYQDEYFINSTNTQKIPSSFSLNSLISYEHDNYRIALTGTNLTDEVNYDAGSNSRAVVSAGRTITLSASVKW